MPRVLPVAALGALLLVAAPATQADPVATAAKACSVSGEETDLGTTYVTSVRARRLRCGRALELVRAYHDCRHERGGADGRCKRFKGFRCREDRTTAPTQYDSRARCRKDGKRFVQRYTQNT